MNSRLHARLVAFTLSLGLMSLIPLSGCSIGPDYHPPRPDMPVDFSEIDPALGAAPPTSLPTSLASTQPAGMSEVTHSYQPAIKWWATFGDLELNSLIERAIRSNLDLRQANLRVSQARAQRIVTGSRQFPDLQATASYDHSRISANGIPIPGAGRSNGAGTAGSIQSPQLVRADATPGLSAGSGSAARGTGFGNFGSEIDLYQAGFDASWELDIFGGVRRRVEAADADVQASVEDRRYVIVSLLAEVARNYIEIRGLQRELAIVQENLGIQQQTVALTQERFHGGVVTELDVARAASQVATTSARIPDLYNQIRMASHRLAVLLGTQPMALMAELTKPAPLPTVPPKVPIGIPSDLLRRRPDIMRAERQLAAQNARIGVATADLFPRIVISGDVALQSLTPRHFFDISSLSASYGPSISWPIFNAGRIRANIRYQNLREEELLANYEKTVLTAVQEVEDALVSYSTEQLRRHAFSDAVAADRRVVEVAREQYNQGTVDFLVVLDAERSQFASQEALAQSDTHVNTSLIALYKALGGGWQGDGQPR